MEFSYRMTKACATIGVEPTVSMEGVTSVYHAKIKYAHPDGTQDPGERKVREDRTKRLRESLRSAYHQSTC